MVDYPTPIMPMDSYDRFMWVGPWPGGLGGATTNEMTLIMEGRGGRGGYGPNITWYPPGAPVLDNWPPVDPWTGMRYIPKPSGYPMGPYGAPRTRYGSAPCPATCPPVACTSLIETPTMDQCGCASGCKTNWPVVGVLGALAIFTLLFLGQKLSRR